MGSIILFSRPEAKRAPWCHEATVVFDFGRLDNVHCRRIFGATFLSELAPPRDVEVIIGFAKRPFIGINCSRIDLWESRDQLVICDCAVRSEEHTSELQSLMRISYAVFCLKKKNNNKQSQRYSHYYDLINTIK